MTGAHPRQTLVVDNTDALSEQAVTLAERFEEAGFLCLASVSAAHLDAVSSGLGQGFQRFSSPDASQRDSLPTFHQVRHWLKDLHGRPLFLWIHSFDAHVPYTPPKPLLREFYPQDRNPYDRSLPELPSHVSPTWLPGLRDVEFARAAYAAEVAYFDERLGKLLEHPLLAQARVAVTADHGESLGEQDSWFTHGRLHPAVLAVPLILSGPGLLEALRGHALPHKITHLDLGRTLLDWAELEHVQFPGRDLLAAAGENRPRYSVSNLGRSASMEFGDWFLVLHLVAHAAPGQAAWERHQVELFDLRSDPACERDLSAAEAERAGRMRALLVEFLVTTEELGWHSSVAADHTRQAHIRALGYASAGADERVPSDWFPLDCDCLRCLPFRE